MGLLGIIPARYASTRLPGKPLVDIGGRSMVMRVFDQAKQARSLSDVVVATDDQRIIDHVQAHGGIAVMTSADHPSGTDRCWEALEKMGASKYSGVVNIQGDEPFIVPAQIDELAAALSQKGAGIATLAQVVTDDRDLDDPGEVLITTDKDFGKLVLVRGLPHSGVVRLPQVPHKVRIELVEKILAHHSEDLANGAVVTAKGDRVRVSWPPSTIDKD